MSRHETRVALMERLILAHVPGRDCIRGGLRKLVLAEAAKILGSEYNYGTASNSYGIAIASLRQQLEMGGTLLDTVVRRRSVRSKVRVVATIGEKSFAQEDSPDDWDDYTIDERSDWIEKVICRDEYIKYNLEKVDGMYFVGLDDAAIDAGLAVQMSHSELCLSQMLCVR